MSRDYIWDPWRTADAHPDRPAVLVNGRTVTFRQLTTRSEELRRGLVAIGVPDGAVIGTSLPTGPELFSLVLAALRGGYGLFPVSRDAGARHRASLLAAAGARLDVVAEAAAATPSVPELTVDDLCSAGARGGGESGVADEPRAGYMIYTSSGTTGEPSVVVPRRPWYSYRGVAVMPRYGAGPDRGPHVMANPAYHFGTLGPALYALQAGSSVAVLPAWSAEEFCAVVDGERAETAFLAPNQLTDLVAARLAPTRRMTCLFHGGSSTPPDIKRQAISLFGPILLEYYGTFAGMITQVTTAQWIERPGTVGRPMPGVRVQIVRDGAGLPAGEVGAIRVRYRVIAREGGGAFEDTGDIGYLDEDGFLYVLGRGSADRQSQTAVLEHLIRSLPGIGDAAIVTGPDGASCVVESLRDPDPGLEDQVRQLCQRMGAGPITVMLGRVGVFPRTASGKLSRVR